MCTTSLHCSFHGYTIVILSPFNGTCLPHPFLSISFTSPFLFLSISFSLTPSSPLPLPLHLLHHDPFSPSLSPSLLSSHHTFLLIPLASSTHQDQTAQVVAVKIFERFDDIGDVSAELTKNYASMRYELNKLHQLDHPYVVKLIGVITNPHSFVLEWAPLFSFELLRKQHAERETHMCPTSLALAMLQVLVSLTLCVCEG